MVVKEYKKPDKGMVGYKEIKNRIRDEFDKELSFDMFEKILKEGHFDLTSDEYKRVDYLAPNP
ncbi:MAG: hypothetical protein NTY20_04610 [Candidatus Aenigmarchaeota archaeon]|nr:hypothetical protein [Candidatus Aenigmarchaeota archaeon]